MYTDGPDGQPDSAFRFNGGGEGSNAISFPSAGKINNKKGKIAFWYRYQDSSGSGYASICGHSSAGNGYALRIMILNPTTLEVNSPDGTASFPATIPNFNDGYYHYYEYMWW